MYKNRIRREEKEFLESFIVQMWAKVTCTIKSSLTGQAAGAIKVAAQKASKCLDSKSKMFFSWNTFFHRY